MNQPLIGESDGKNDVNNSMLEDKDEWFSLIKPKV